MCIESNKPAEYIYILGAGGSGSTLLELVLGGHPQLAAMGELALFPLQLFRKGPYRCSCGQLLADCPVWRCVLAAIRERFGFDLREKPFRFRVSDTGLEEDRGMRAFSHWLLHNYYRFWRYAGYRRTPLLRHGAFLSFYHRTWAANRLFIADVFRQTFEARGVIDSSKDYIGFRDLYGASDRPMKAIFLTRDVRGVVCTYLRKNPRAHVAEAARHWKRVNERALFMLQGIPETDHLHVKHEDLCCGVEAQCQRLCEFLGYEYDPSMCDLGRHTFHTIGGSRVRYTGIQKIEVRLNWKQALSQDQLHEIDELAGPLARELGYGCPGESER